MVSDVNVLLVDDNPVIVEMLRKALESVAHISAVRSGDDALERLGQEAPDLIVSDFNMPGTDGRDLVQQLRSRSASARIPVILMASRADQNEKLGMLRDAVEDFIDKPFFMREAVSRIKRVVDKIALEKMAREAPAKGVVRGTLSQMNAIDLLQSLELGRKSCKLNVASDGKSCDMYFVEGQLMHAVAGDVKGDDAVYKVLMFSEGDWELDFNSTTTEQTTTRSTQSLLMEGLRLFDEANRDADEDNILDG